MWIISQQKLINLGLPTEMLQPHPLGWALETWVPKPSLMNRIQKSSPEWLYQKENQDYSMVMSVLVCPLNQLSSCSEKPRKKSVGYIVAPLQQFSDGAWGKARGSFYDFNDAWSFALAEYYRERLQNIQNGEHVCDWHEFNVSSFKPFLSPIHQCAEQGNDRWWKDDQWNKKNHRNETLMDTFERVIFSFSPYENNVTASKSLTLLAQKITNIPPPSWRRVENIAQKICNNSEKYSVQSVEAWRKFFALWQEKKLKSFCHLKTLQNSEVEKI